MVKAGGRLRVVHSSGCCKYLSGKISLLCVQPLQPIIVNHLNVGHLTVDSLTVDTLTVGILTFDILMVGTLTVGTLTVDTSAVGYLLIRHLPLPRCELL